jgi:hypothetical protein
MFSEFIPDVLRIAGQSWFIWLPILALLMFGDAWHSYIRNYYKNSLQWVYLEIKIPREIRRGPKAMEQVFASLHSFMGGPSDWYDRWWTGEMQLWYSFEIASFGGDIHFYLRTPLKHKNYIEANLYAQYPDLEIEETDDYTLRMPSHYDAISNAGYEIFGSVLELSKDDVYPIRLYEEFETPSEYSTLDPISSLIEVMNSIKPGEELWIQLLTAPVGSSWQEKGATFVRRLQERTRTIISNEEGGRPMVDRTPGEELALKAIERNIAKPGYQTLIRYIFLAPKETYSKQLPWYGVLGAFNQYTSKAHNSFRHNGAVRTAVLWYYWPFFFPNFRGTYRRRDIYSAFKNRRMEESGFLTQFFTNQTLRPSQMVLNTEELATIYHYPSNIVLTAPAIQRVESRKVGPPASLPAEPADSLPEGFKTKSQL